jgi:hypothetical protein
LTPTEIISARHWLASAQSGRQKVGNAFWSQCGKEVDPLAGSGKNAVIQRAANLPAVAQAERVQMVSLLYERPVRCRLHSLAVHQRVHPELPCDSVDAPILPNLWVPDFLIASQAAVATDYDALRRHALVELILKRHRLVQPQCLQLAFGKLYLHVLQVSEGVLSQAGGDVPFWLRGWRDRRVPPHQSASPWLSISD